MILKRYGTSLHSVTPNFDPRAMNELGFRKSEEMSISAEDFAADYESVGAHELTGVAEGHVQHEAEQGVLTQIREQLDALEAALGEHEVLVIESEQGRDYPKMREKISNVVIGTENKLHFSRTVDPPLRIGVYAQRKR